MRLHRFYVQQPLGEELDVDEKNLVHQWSSVFRLHAGDRVLLFSFTHPSYDYEYQIQEISKKRVTLTCLGKTPNISPKKKSALYMSLVKKDTFETIVRHATELLITDIIPVISARSEKKNLNFERLSLIAKEASEQCGRGDVPTIHPIISFKEACSFCDSSHVIFHTATDEKHGSLFAQASSRITSVWVGPEGGWTEQEIRLAQEKGVQVGSLGESILKADTAAIVGMTKVFLF